MKKIENEKHFTVSPEIHKIIKQIALDRDTSMKKILTDLIKKEFKIKEV